MPSAEEMTYLIEVMPDAGNCVSQDSFTSHDVDVLVSRIKENLRLSGLKSRSSLAQKMRVSPYRLPTHTLDETKMDRRCRKGNYFNSELKDSYERFEALLRKGGLIKEAVKRLQACPEDHAAEEVVEEEEEDDDDDDEDEDVATKVTRLPTNNTTSLDSMYSEEVGTWYMDTIRDVRYEDYRIAKSESTTTTSTTTTGDQSTGSFRSAAPSCL